MISQPLRKALVILRETPTPAVTDAAETPEAITSLTLWVPPEMDPELETPAAQLCASASALFGFERQSDDQCAFKAASGPGGS